MRIPHAFALVTAGVLALWPGAAVASAESPCADLAGTVDGNTCRIHTSTDTYTFDATFPIDYPDAAPMIDYLKQTRDGFVNVSNMPGSTNLPYVLESKAQEYRSGGAPGGTQSVVFEIYQNVGGAHPVTWYKSFNYDIDTRTAITYDTLFAPGSKPLPVIFPIVQREIDRTLGSTVPISPSDGLNPANYQNFAITDDELIFFFGQGDVLPSAAGANEAHVPRTAVASMLAYPGANP